MNNMVPGPYASDEEINRWLGLDSESAINLPAFFVHLSHRVDILIDEISDIHERVANFAALQNAL